MNGESFGFLDSLLLKFRDKQSLYAKYLFKGDLEYAKKLALEMFKEYPQYLLLYSYLDLEVSKKLLFRIMKEIKNVDLSFIYILLRDPRISYEELSNLSLNLEGELFIHKSIRKALFLKKYSLLQPKSDNQIIFEETQDGLHSVRHIPEIFQFSSMRVEIHDQELKKSITDEINSLIDVIDDFELYKFAIIYDIEISSKKTFNYHWYRAIKFKDQVSAIHIIRSSTDFNDIQRLAIHCNIDDIEEPTYKILIRFLKNGYQKDIANDMFGIYSANKNYFNTKVFLSILIASREENLIILAYFISSSTNFTDNYEIDLIHLFLNRYYCFHSEIQKQLKNLDVKNVQNINNAYIWTDPMIISNSYLSEKRRSFINSMDLEFKAIKRSFTNFMNSNRVAHSLSVLRLYNRFKEFSVFKEVNEMKILCTEKNTLFSLLLGEKCRYLFDKLTCENKRVSSGCLDTLYTKLCSKFDDKLFENGYIQLDKLFKARFKGLVANN